MSARKPPQRVGSPVSASSQQDDRTTSSRPSPISLDSHTDDGSGGLFEACRSGDLTRVRRLVNPQNVNARDTAGRKSTPLHFAAGKTSFCAFCQSSLFAVMLLGAK